MGYIWQSKNWSNFYYDEKRIDGCLEKYQKQKDRTELTFSLLSTDAQKNIHAETLSSDIVASSSLEGDEVDFASVYSSIAAALDIDIKRKGKSDKRAENLALLMQEVNGNTPLSEETLFRWHTLLFLGMGVAFLPKCLGEYRKEGVYVIDRNKKEDRIIYEGLPFEEISEEMAKLFAFIESKEKPLLVKSAIVSFWFVSIHPFGDGNGRLSRFLSDYILAQEKKRFRCYSVSSAILKKKKEYYAELYKAQHSENMDLTEYIEWFASIVTEALETAEEVCSKKIKVAQFMLNLDPQEYNSREINMLYRLASGSFYGKLTSEKWRKLTKCQAASATRDLTHLVERGLLLKSGEGGRNTSYIFNEESFES